MVSAGSGADLEEYLPCWTRCMYYWVGERDIWLVCSTRKWWSCRENPKIHLEHFSYKNFMTRNNAKLQYLYIRIFVFLLQILGFALLVSAGDAEFQVQSACRTCTRGSVLGWLIFMGLAATLYGGSGIAVRFFNINIVNANIKIFFIVVGSYTPVQQYL